MPKTATLTFTFDAEFHQALLVAMCRKYNFPGDYGDAAAVEQFALQAIQRGWSLDIDADARYHLQQQHEAALRDLSQQTAAAHAQIFADATVTVAVTET